MEKKSHVPRLPTTDMSNDPKRWCTLTCAIPKKLLVTIRTLSRETAPWGCLNKTSPNMSTSHTSLYEHCSKSLSHFIESWLVYRHPFIGSLYSSIYGIVSFLQNHQPTEVDRSHCSYLYAPNVWELRFRIPADIPPWAPDWSGHC